MPRNARHGVTASEHGAAVSVGAALTANILPMTKRARLSAQGLGSASNLMQIGQGAGMYGLDNADRIPTFSWGGPESGSHAAPRYTLPDGSMVVARTDAAGASAQLTEILQRRTGRINGDFAIVFSDTRLPQRRFTNVVLADYMGSPVLDSLFIDPADANQLGWAASPLDYGPGSTVPYANGFPPGYEDISTWADEGVRQRWAFASSYQSVPASWQPDRPGSSATAYAPVADSPHLFAVVGAQVTNGVELSDGRRFSEVRFPTGKVYQFEEFDREQAGNPYFGYDHARVEKLMFDGSVNSFASGDASPSWDGRGQGKVLWEQTYVPLDTFPVPLGGLGDDTLLSQRFRWTVAGLKGVDYRQPLMGTGQTRRSR